MLKKITKFSRINFLLQFFKKIYKYLYFNFNFHNEEIMTFFAKMVFKSCLENKISNFQAKYFTYIFLYLKLYDYLKIEKKNAYFTNIGNISFKKRHSCRS